MKRAYFFLFTALLGLIFYTSGSHKEISDRVMVHAVGIDRADGGYKVTLQVFSPAGGGTETAFDPSQPNVSLVKAEGGSVAEAVHECETKLGGRVFIGHNRIILFGRGVDFTHEDELFGYFLSSAEAYLNTDCAAAEDTAEELLSIPIPSSAVSSEKFVEMIRSSEERGCAVGCTMIGLLEAMNGGSPDRCVVMPEFSKLKKGRPEKKQEETDKLTADSGLVLDKGVIYLGGRRAGELSGSETGLLGMINGSGEQVFTELDSDGMKLGKTFRISGRSVTPEISAEGICFHVKCRAVPKDDQFFRDNDERIRSNEQACEKLSRNAERLAERLCTEYSPELLGADRYLRRSLPSLLRSCGGSPEKLYGKMSFKIELE